MPVQPDPVVAITTEHLGRSQRPCVRLAPTLEGDAVTLDHDQDEQVVRGEAPDHFTLPRPTVEARVDTLLPGVKIGSARACFSAEGAEDGHVGGLASSRRR